MVWRRGWTAIKRGNQLKSKAMENIDWESCQNKYQDMEKYIANYPSPEQAAALEKIYPHTKEEMNKAILTTKLKSIRQKYRKA